MIQVCTPEGAIKRVDALRCRLDLRGETPALAWQTPNSECIHDVHEREELLGLTCTYEKLCALTSRTATIPEVGLLRLAELAYTYSASDSCTQDLELLVSSLALFSRYPIHYLPEISVTHGIRLVALRECMCIQ